MVRMRFRERAMNDGDEIEIGNNAMAVSIHTDPTGDRMSFVTWLEEVKE